MYVSNKSEQNIICMRVQFDLISNDFGSIVLNAHMIDKL